MAKRKPTKDEYEVDDTLEEEYEEEYEEEDEGGSIVEAVTDSSWRKTATVPLILILFAVGIWMMWKRYRDDVYSDVAYRLAPQKVIYTQPPEWIDRDILEEVFKLGSLDQKCVLDEGITMQIAGAFELHPWVEKVERVVPASQSKLQVALSYRTPVAMVLLPDEDPHDAQGPMMLPIDANAVQLPWEDFNHEFANTNFPRIDVGNTYPTGPVGSNWGDDIVTKAARIAEILHGDWDNLKEFLHRVERSSQPTSNADTPDFDLRGLPGPEGGPGLVIHWGRAPGDEQAVEPTAKAKLKKLQQWLNDFKMTGVTLDEIDLRSNRSMRDSMQAAKVLSTNAARRARLEGNKVIR